MNDITNTCERCGKKWKYQHHCKPVKEMEKTFNEVSEHQEWVFRGENEALDEQNAMDLECK